jgi:guanine deaminase
MWRSLATGGTACIIGGIVGYASIDASEAMVGYRSKFKAESNTDDQSHKQVESLTKAHSASATSILPEVKESDSFMDIAVAEAVEGVVKGEGGPFGAVIVGPDGKIVARAHNMVLQHNDPTAHAEVTCIRKACARLGRFDLSDCVIYSSCEPCPMCYGAIHWAKLPECKYAATAADAAEAGFDDQFIYDAIRNVSEEEHCSFSHEPHKGACGVFKAEYSLY